MPAGRGRSWPVPSRSKRVAPGGCATGKGPAVNHIRSSGEALVATFKSELVDGQRFPSFEHAEHDVLHWIGFYNGERPHEALDDLPPAEYEELN